MKEVLLVVTRVCLPSVVVYEVFKFKSECARLFIVQFCSKSVSLLCTPLVCS